MGRVEDVTLPARFLTTTAHLIATLTIVYDAEDTTRRALGSDQTDLASWQSNLEGLAWTSLIFFAIEFAGMFAGVSLFMPTANAYYIFSHFFGAVFVGLFVCLNWEIASYHWFFTLFSFFPALCETALAFAVTQMSVMQYK